MNHMVDREFILFQPELSLSRESLVTLKIKMAPFFEKNDEIFFGRYAQVDV